jgi:hypothetical protein
MVNKFQHENLKKKFHVLARQHGYDMVKVTASHTQAALEEFYAEIRELAPKEEQSLWPKNLSVYSQYDPKYFFTQPKEAEGHLKMLAGKNKPDAEKIAKLKDDLIRSEINFTTICKRNSALEKENQRLKEELLAVKNNLEEANTELSVLRKAEDSADDKPVQSKKNPPKTLFEQVHVPVTSKPGICTDFLSIKDLPSPAAREAAMMSEKREHLYHVYMNGDDKEAFCYAYQIYFAFITCYKIKSHTEYLRLRTEKIKNRENRAMYPENPGEAYPDDVLYY